MSTMSKIIIAAAVILVALGILPLFRQGYDAIDEVVNHLRQTRYAAYWFEKEGILKVEGKPDEGKYKYFRLRNGDFEKLCKQLEPDGWKSDRLFTTRSTGRVWILYGRNVAPFAVEWMKGHENEATAEANRLIWQYKLKRAGLFLGIAITFLLLATACRISWNPKHKSHGCR